MPLTKERKAELATKYGKNENDTGNSDVQIALLTERINQITAHLKTFKLDHHSRYGLLKLVGQRRSLLDYLAKQNIGRYRDLIKKLNIRK